jgi:hypothetical protein
MKRSIVNFFDPYCIEHLKAFDVMQKTGFWPKGFVPEDVEFPTLWHVSIAAKIVDAWMDQVKADNIVGIPPWEEEV